VFYTLKLEQFTRLCSAPSFDDQIGKRMKLPRVDETLSIERIRTLALEGNLILYGAGTAVSSYARIAMWALETIGVKPSLFIDDDLSRENSRFEGVPVVGPSHLEHMKKPLTIIITSNYFESIFRSLRQHCENLEISSMKPLMDGINVNEISSKIPTEEVHRRMHTHYAKLRRVLGNSASKEELYFNALDIQVTEKCTMKCLDCSNLMQYYENPKNIPMSTVLEKTKLLLASIDKLADARLIGGEPFLNKELNRIIDCLSDSPKVDHITIYSNATFVPRVEIIEAMSRAKNLHVEFTDYDELSRGKAKLPDLLEKHNIKYFFHKPQNWTDSSRLVQRDLSEIELTQMFEACCVNDALTLLGDRVYHCPFSANLYNLDAVSPVESDWVTISQEDTPTTLRGKLAGFYYKQPFLSACRNCAGRDFQQDIVPAAIQVKRFIPINLRNEWKYVDNRNS